MAHSRICSIPDCGKAAWARSWCGAHYYKWRMHGDPLGGRPPKKEIRQYFEDVVLSYQGDDCLRWPYGRGGAGYGYINHKLVHRLACERTHGAPPTQLHEAAHSCGKGHEGCCNPRHISWKTPSENFDDKRTHGTVVRGSSVSVSKLTEQQVREIRALKGKMSQRAIGDLYGIKHSNVRNIFIGASWGWLPD